MNSNFQLGSWKGRGNIFFVLPFSYFLNFWKFSFPLSFFIISHFTPSFHLLLHIKHWLKQAKSKGIAHIQFPVPAHTSTTPLMQHFSAPSMEQKCYILSSINGAISAPLELGSWLEAHFCLILKSESCSISTGTELDFWSMMEQKQDFAMAL